MRSWTCAGRCRLGRACTAGNGMWPRTDEFCGRTRSTEHEVRTHWRYGVLLEKRNAVIYGGGGSIGRAVALAFAREGARVHLAGRTMESLERVASEVRSAGGEADT